MCLKLILGCFELVWGLLKSFGFFRPTAKNRRLKIAMSKYRPSRFLGHRAGIALLVNNSNFSGASYNNR